MGSTDSHLSSEAADGHEGPLWETDEHEDRSVVSERQHWSNVYVAYTATNANRLGGLMDDHREKPGPLPGDDATAMFKAKPTNRFLDVIQSVALGIFTGVKGLWPF